MLGGRSSKTNAALRQKLEIPTRYIDTITGVNDSDIFSVVTIVKSQGTKINTLELFFGRRRKTVCAARDCHLMLDRETSHQQNVLCAMSYSSVPLSVVSAWCCNLEVRNTLLPKDWTRTRGGPADSQAFSRACTNKIQHVSFCTLNQLVCAFTYLSEPSEMYQNEGGVYLTHGSRAHQPVSPTCLAGLKAMCRSLTHLDTISAS